MIAFILRHAGKILLLTALLVAGSFLVIPHLAIENDIIKQMPSNNKVFATFRDAVKETGTLDVFLVVLRLDEKIDVDSALQFADDLADNLETSPLISRVEYRLPDPTQTYHLLLPHIMAISTDEEWKQLEKKLSPRDMRKSLDLLANRLQAPLSLSIKRWFRVDPLGLIDVYRHRFDRLDQGFSLDFTTGYYLSKDHRFLILLTRPVKPAQDMIFSRKLIKEVKNIEEKTLTSFRKSMDLPDFSIRIDHGGTYVVALEDGSLVKNDMFRNIATSFIGVLILFLFAFRRFGSLIFASVPIIVGLLFTFAFATFTLHEVNAASSAFAALLIGLAIDFVIVIYARYIEERGEGRTVSEACRRTSHATYKPILMGAITTAGTFSSFLITTLPGLQELGLLTSMGILICMGTIFLLLPAMFGADEGRKRPPKLYLHSFGSDAIVGFTTRHARIVVATAVILAVVSLYLALQIPFIDDANAMRSPKNKGVILRKELAASYGASFSSMMVLVRGDTEEELVEKNHLLGRYLNKMKARGVIVRHSGLYQFLPSAAWQEENIEKRSEAFSADKVNQIQASFIDGCRANQLNASIFTPFLDEFVQALQSSRPLSIETLPKDDILVRNFIRHDTKGWESVVSIYPPPKRWRREPPPQLESWIKKDPSHYRLTGINVLSREMRTIARRDALRATALGFFVVFCLLLMDFRKISLTLFSLIPLGFGILWMLGTMKILDIPLNSMNIFVIAMIIGIGVDYGIHVVHRYMEGGDEPWLNVARTGNAIVVAALSTMLGFGTLTMSHFPGLKSMGLVAIMGAGYCAVASLTIFPAVIKLWHLPRD